MSREHQAPHMYPKEYREIRERVNSREPVVPKPKIYELRNPIDWHDFNESLMLLPQKTDLAPWKSKDPNEIRNEALKRGILLDVFPDILKDIASSKHPRDYWQENSGLLERYLNFFDKPHHTSVVEFPWLPSLGHYVVIADEKATRETIYSRTVVDDERLITHEDFRKAGELKVGIIGMGVGSSIGDALIEFGVRDIRVVDGGKTAMHDFSRLPNAGFPRIGMNHAVHWTQRAYEMYPYGNFECIPQNIGDGTKGSYPREEFLEGLDLLFEVVDTLPEKIRSREAAREKGIKVLMPTDLLMGADMMYQAGSPDAEIFPNLTEEDKRKVFAGKFRDFVEVSELAFKLVGPHADYWLEQAKKGKGNWSQNGAQASASKVAVARTLRRLLRGQEIPHRKGFLLDNDY